MRNLLKNIVLLFLLSTSYNFAQISPGDLTKSHAKYEGMSNCTLCHDLGNKVSNNLCLDCHKDIQTLIKQDRGYHVSSDVKNKDCFQCHNEHHGRKFEMIRFDKDKFKHDLTGYKLEGKHDEIDCKKCHTSDFIADKDIKKRPNTFIGLDTKCLSCHADYHQKTLSSNDCKSCHNTEKFSPAINFDHDEADFKLKGKHLDVDCVKCHKETKRNGKDFQNFNNLSFKDCKSCHDSPHEENIKGSCKQCHTETSFKSMARRSRFNHNLTNFTLKGAHKKVDCFSCHAKNADPKLVFQDRIGIDENNCIKCHDDKHKGKLGNDCAKCHDEKAFVSLKTLEFFDHKLTDFPLEGLHQKVDCIKCHKEEKYTEAIDFSACKNCHDDYHKGEFDVNGAATDCKTCHSVKEGFDLSLFTTEQHQETKFPLKGAHNATPCFACHKSDPEQERWAFKNIGSKCVDCHQDLHQDFIDTKYYPDKKCESCHNNEAWTDVNFDHAQTDWPLKGKHIDTDCRSCHFRDTDKKDGFVQIFTNLESDCSNCHKDKHENEFAINGVTDCLRCHIYENWTPEKFDHNTTAFRLEGRHAEIECSQCHIAATDNKNTPFNYKIEKHQCIDCHR